MKDPEHMVEMMNQFARTELLWGAEAMKRLADSRVAVFGIGGVGGYAVEALVRSGIGALDLIDPDRFSLTNLNRQLYATHKTIGQYKVDAAAERVREINPDCRVTAYRTFFLPEARDSFDFTRFDYVIDAIDTVTGKLALVETAREAGTPIICAMGAGNKTDPAALRVGDIYETSVCPLARIMRSECRKRGIDHLKVVSSTEPPLRPKGNPEALRESEGGGFSQKGETGRRRDIPGSTAFVPSAMGLILAREVVMDLIRGTV